MNKIDFEKADDTHLPEIADIYNYYVHNSTATFHKHSLTIEEMRELIVFDDPRFASFIIRSGGIICGYVILTHYKKREAYYGTAEVTIYLRHDFTQKGIGRAAVDFIESYAKENDFHNLIAIICGDNSASIRLFEKCGYMKCAHYHEVGHKFGKYLDIVAYEKIIS